MLPVQITIRDIPGSPALESHIRSKTNKLKQFYDRMVSCRIVVEFAQKHKHRGKLYNVRIDVSVPGKELVVTRKSNEDVYLAIRDAFSALIRQLENHSHKRHGRVKTHTDVMHGRIARMREDEGYGFIEGMDGNEYYFSVTNVKYPGYERLMIGDSVEYIPEPVNDGWQACHVVRERNHRSVTS
jgi:ribosomal subunit interface protein